MGLFDSVLGALGAQGSSSHAELLNAVVGLLHDDAPGGGLGGLVSKFQQGGLGDVIGSWIGPGHNLPISADQLQSVLGSDTVSRLAQQLGLSGDEVSAKLSQLLPGIVDHLTPNGQLPAGGLGDLGSLLGRLAQR